MVLVDFLHEYTLDKLTSRWPWVTIGQKMTNNSKKQPYCSSLTPTAFGFVVFTLSRRNYATMITLSSWRLCGEKRTELPLHTNLNAQVIEKTWKKGHLKTNPRWKKYAWICLAIHCFDGLPWLSGKFDHGASRTIHGSSPQFSARKPLICTKNSQDLAIPSKLSSIMVAPNLTYKCDCYSYLFVFVVWLFGMFHSGTSADG